MGEQPACVWRPIPRRGELTTRVKEIGVGGVREQREVGDRVLDLGALVELRAADHLVGDVVADERVLEHPALGVGPVEDRDLVRAIVLLGDEPLDLAGDVARLRVLVVELGDHDRLPAPGLGPEVLLLLLAVVGDDRVGRVEDRLGRAVVLLELDDLGAGEVALEVEDVADVGAAEAVDRLGVVADDRQVAVLLGQQLQQPVLRAVRVLVLVDEEPAEGALVALADVLEELEAG